MTTAVVLMGMIFSHLSVPYTSILYKVEGAQYKIYCVLKHGYRCAAVESRFPFLTCPFTKMFAAYRKYVMCQNMITAVPVLLLWQPEEIL